MNIKYYYEFKGLDEVLNRVEILTSDIAQPEEIKATASPFILEYKDVKKLEAVQGSGASLNLVSESIFQFVDLHTDDMQGYKVKFYRDGSLYWIGWLDSELYEENLSLFPPYPVEFTAADFNILERLKYRDNEENTYNDVVSMLEHLKRCFMKLSLDFDKLYIGCTTTADGIELLESETIFHKLYIQSSNFYDEDGEPMSCREVVESIIQPFGLMMIQRDASVYIYDYNTIDSASAMKCYNFSDLSYLGSVNVSFSLGDLKTIGFISMDSSFGYEEMINNVSITSSIYADKSVVKCDVSEDTLSEKKPNEVIGDKYKIEYYAKDKNIESLNASEFVVYTNTDNDSNMSGLYLPYDPIPDSDFAKFRMKGINDYIVGNPNYYINIKVQAYANTRDNPFNSDDNPKDEYNTKVLFLKCNLYFVDTNNIATRYYSNTGILTGGWFPVSDYSKIPQGKFELFFTSNKDTEIGNALNSWITNSNIDVFRTIGESYPKELQEKNFAKGQNVKLFNGTNGYIIFEVTNECYVYKTGQGGFYPYMDVKNVLVNNLEISIKNLEKEDIKTDDYKFKSYVNKKVSSDFGDITLKCISANEEKIPVGKGNILKKDQTVFEGIVLENFYSIHTAFSRSGQTDILERLLMCTIHSNFTRKNRVFKVNIKMTDNPMMRYCTYNTVLGDGKFLMLGCTLDFRNACTAIKSSDFSADVDVLSNIPYE